MKISALIEQLQELQKKYGGLETRTQTLSHMWKPEPTVRDGNGAKYVLLNP